MALTRPYRRCRYDVKYGSAGWNSYGYQGGCEFASGSKSQAMKDPKARRYLCSESQDWDFMCTHDFTGDGVCISDPLLEGFKQVLQVRPADAALPPLPPLLCHRCSATAVVDEILYTCRSYTQAPCHACLRCEYWRR